MEQSGIHAEVEIEIEVMGEVLTIRTASRSRTGWEEAFAAMASQHDDVLVDEVSTTGWDLVEWEW